MSTALSPVTRRYLREFALRLAVFLLVGAVWLFSPGRLDFTAPLDLSHWPLALLWAGVLGSMLVQLNPNSGLTAGCMKQFPQPVRPRPGL